jgi:hypothetical protein
MATLAHSLNHWRIRRTGALTIFAAMMLSAATARLAGDAPPAPPFVILPYLQLPTPTGMTVMWETDQKLPSRVEYGTTAQLGEAVTVEKSTVLHEVRLENLRPGTRYHYRVRSGELTSEFYSFRSAPPLGTKRWRMAVYGDSRSNPAVHHQVADQIARAKVDLIVHTGDIVLNGAIHDLWRREFFEPLGSLARSVPWVSTIGNHERDSAHYFSYMALPGNERYFGLDFANAHIVGLDSNGWIDRGRDSKQYLWMREHLRAKRSATWMFVAFHHPLFSAHATRPMDSLRWDWGPLFLDPENHVDGVLTGHDHFYARNYRMGHVAAEPRAGVLFLTTAGGGAFLYRCKPRDYVAQEKSIHHFTLFDFDDDKVTLSAIDTSGAVFDRYVLTKKPDPPEEFCAYEMEEIKQFLRQALPAQPPVRLDAKGATTVAWRVRVPSRIGTTVRGQMRWEKVPGWNFKQPTIDFSVDPGQVLEIPIEAEVNALAFPHCPSLTLAFEPGKFRNRTVEIHPFRLAGPEHVVVGRAATGPSLEGKREDVVWSKAKAYPLVAQAPMGGSSDQAKLMADEKCLYLRVRLEDPAGKVRMKNTGPVPRASPEILGEEFVRAAFGQGQDQRVFVAAPDQGCYATSEGKPLADTEWRATMYRDGNAWCVETALPRAWLDSNEPVRFNVMHRRREAKGFSDFELCPYFKVGTDPDVIPDWKLADEPGRWAALIRD